MTSPINKSMKELYELYVDINKALYEPGSSSISKNYNLYNVFNKTLTKFYLDELLVWNKNARFYLKYRSLCRCLDSLHIDNSPSFVFSSNFKTTSNIDGLNLDDSGGQKLIKKILGRLFTFQSYMNEALYNKNFGYYTTKKESVGQILVHILLSMLPILEQH